MFFAFGLFLFVDLATGKRVSFVLAVHDERCVIILKVPCFVMAALLNYFFLAVFCWMLCESVMLYLLLVVVFSKLSKRLWFFLLLGWGKVISTCAMQQIAILLTHAGPPVLIFAVTLGAFRGRYIRSDYGV
jgi:hypothetical protein